MRNSRAREKTIAGCKVTRGHLEAPRRTFRIEDITRVDVRRTLFLFTLPVILGVLFMVFANSELIYGHEKLLTLTVVAVVGFGSFNVGFVHLTGFNLNGSMASFGLYKEAQQLKKELASYSHRGSSRNRGRWQ